LFLKWAFLTPSRRRKRDTQSTLQEVIRTEFYELCRKEVDDRDKYFVKQDDEDLNATLVLVGCSHASSRRPVLTRVTAWSVFNRISSTWGLSMHFHHTNPTIDGTF